MAKLLLNKYLFGATSLAGLWAGFNWQVKSAELHPEYNMSLQEKCAMLNYSFEKHNVTTPDGYILEMWRIFRPGQELRYPVLMVHGMSNSAECYTMNVNTKPLGFRLVDEGYDVWLGNCRGNKFSRKHTSLNPLIDSQYWDWTCEDIALVDVPTFIQQIQSTTQHKQIGYIGQSQGGAVGACLLSQHPELSENIKVLICLTAPGPYLTNKCFYLRFTMMELLLRYKLYTKNYIVMDQASEWFCRLIRTFQGLATHLSKSIYDPHVHNDQDWSISVYVGKISAGTSVKNIQFVKQLMNYEPRDYLVRYDYGSSEENQRRYGQPLPPKIHFSKLEVPVAILYGSLDTVVTPEDSQAFINSVRKDKLIFCKEYPLDHGGALLSSYTEHYDDIVSILNKFD